MNYQIQCVIFFPAAMQLEKTCSAVASYLLFHPDDETMLSNKQYYSKQAGVSEDWFVPRKV